MATVRAMRAAATAASARRRRPGLHAVLEENDKGYNYPNP